MDDNTDGRGASGGTVSATMRAVVVSRTGGLDALQPAMVPVPEPQPGWVRIKVKAFGVNESEVTTRKGESDPEVTYPRIPGIEGVVWSTPTRAAGRVRGSRWRP
ncbi:alcohol dehydrogenase catalytic domain-containing protein [Streptomyces sp. NPDC017890]|uniref:alcohol dehydrogenase catalytic domain-containing protein n=1 Tax=Streptomyces sp. NPDC017890 TaxID=3365015 RepID=UPI0037BB6121